MPTFKITAKTPDGGWREFPPLEAETHDQAAAYVMKLLAHTPWSEANLMIKDTQEG